MRMKVMIRMRIKKTEKRGRHNDNVAVDNSFDDNENEEAKRR